MKRVGGKTVAALQEKKTVKNSIGERENSWETVQLLRGVLDLSSGESKYTENDAKMQESTHVFITDCTFFETTAESGRLVIDGKRYDIMLIDDPCGLHSHSEIYLKYTGGQ